MTRRVDLAVVGGGISGLAAAWEARRHGVNVAVLDAADTPGGKLRTTPLAGTGIALDEGADAFFAKVPEAVDLCAELGLTDELMAPATGTAYVWSEGALRRLPPDQFLGVPTDLDAVAASGILSPAGVDRARADLTAIDDRPEGGDEAFGALVRRRLGDEVLDRLVAPLLGGIWAGDCDRLSFRVAAPVLADARDRDPSLVRGAAAVRAETGTDGDKPVFLAPAGGMQRLVDALGERLGDRLVCRAPVAALEQDGGAGWRLTIADPDGRHEPATEDVVAERVVLATPAFVTAHLLAGIAPPVATYLGGIGYASVILTTLVVPRDAIDHPLDGSGFLVPPSSGRVLTACSWATSKWAHLAREGSTDIILRASAGRDGDKRAMAMPDGELVDALCGDLRDTMGLRAAPTAIRVSRWGRSFPQPRPGHLDALAAAETTLAHLAPGLAIVGAWARGVGIPACIRGSRGAVTRLLDGSRVRHDNFRSSG